MRPYLSVIAFAALGCLVSCSPQAPEPVRQAGSEAAMPETEPRPAMVRGEVVLSGADDLPAGAVIKVELRRGGPIPAPADASTSVLELATDAGAPYTFEIAVPAWAEPGEDLSVFARAQSGPAILYNNLEGVPVTALDAPVRIVLRSTEDWGSSGGLGAVTPPLVSYHCGDGVAPIQLAIETGAVFLSLEGGGAQRLEPADPETGDGVYSNGQLSVQVLRDEYGAQSVRFARGRSAFLDCAKD